MSGRIPQEVLGFANVGLAVAHVSGAEVAVSGLGVGVYTVGAEVVAQEVEELVKGGAVANGYVVDLVEGGRRCCGRQEVGLDCVGNKAEVAAGFAVAVDVDGLALEQGGCPFGDDRGVGAVRVLAWTKDVEVAQADGLKAVAAGKDVGIQLIDVFGHGVGAEWFAYAVFYFGEGWVVAVGAAAGGVGEALHLGVASGYQHVEEAADVGGVGGGGVGQAAGDAAQGGLVQHVVHAVTGFLAVFWIADVALPELEVGPLGWGNQGSDFVQVALVAGGEVVQPHHALVELEQGFKQIAANKAGRAGNEPGAGGFGESGLKLFVGGHGQSRPSAAPWAKMLLTSNNTAPGWP